MGAKLIFSRSSESFIACPHHPEMGNERWYPRERERKREIGDSGRIFFLRRDVFPGNRCIPWSSLIDRDAMTNSTSRI